MKLDWEKMGGLIPAVVQDVDTAEVLMVGFMDEAALESTRETGRVTFFSRSRQQLWTKGETSGNFLELVDLAVDCDADTLLVIARPAGPVCHLGTQTCFGGETRAPLSFLGRLDRLIKTRETERPEGSYTSRLFESGAKRIGQKVGEEAVETALAAVAGERDELLDEAADLVYHLLVLLRAGELSLSELATRLGERHGNPARRPGD
ncbi:MAG: bifunctional phosphoribosyl-AMP cyclohydrolase/phosphoribosyl-ATP diphosphatase HisIE [Xanthomonadales bacterium]|nr:bifunctional phosphoribosyl-AMP cyclohydrolase/phosphoribosyl-ATP diphosphatase HisIE [Xanthomonadales bacterium]